MACWRAPGCWTGAALTAVGGPPGGKGGRTAACSAAGGAFASLPAAPVVALGVTGTELTGALSVPVGG
eukprot:5847895-Alexandrium_andersonii.AAC.1